MAKKIGKTTLYEAGEVSNLLDVTIETIRKYIKDGQLRAKTIGKKQYITETALQDFIDAP